MDRRMLRFLIYIGLLTDGYLIGVGNSDFENGGWLVLITGALYALFTIMMLEYSINSKKEV